VGTQTCTEVQWSATLQRARLHARKKRAPTHRKSGKRAAQLTWLLKAVQLV